MAVLSAGGTRADWSERFMTLVIKGLMAQMLSFIRAVGTGSRAQVEGFILLMIPSTSRCVVMDKQLRGWEIASGGAGGTGGVVVLESWERMASTLFVKKVMKLLHCSSVKSV